MIRVDDRIGSREFKRLLVRLGVPAKIKRLEYADFSFLGNGPTGKVRIGVERKTLSELVTAVEDNRFIGHQLPGLLKIYDWVYIICEGTYRPDRMSGLLMIGKWEAGHGRDRHLYENFEKFVLSLERKARVTVRPTTGKIHTAYFIAALYRWASKSWDSHKSVYKVDETKPDTAITDDRTVKRKVLAQIPAIGWKRSGAAERAFASIHAAITATEAEWCQVKWTSSKGRPMRIGPGTAKQIVRLLHAEQDETKAKGR